MPAMNRVIPITLCLLATQPPDIVCAANPWPAEANTAALKLPVFDPYFKKNMSGAYWNATTRTFWVCCNGPGSFWALVEDKPDTWKIATQPGGKQARWITGGDMEGICQTDDTKPLVYLMDETGYIREFDVSKFGVVKALRTWDIRASAGPNGGNLEGIALVSHPKADGWIMLTDDDNTNDEALTLDKHFRPNQDTDNDGLTDDWELYFFGSTAITDGTVSPL